ncbi:MAG: O-antigen ligase family protein [Bacillota bacterium]|jgi:teichuronic acid biosynthesis protein TuaE
MKYLKTIWFLALITSFFGPTLAIPGYESIFAYRILLVVHVIGFLGYCLWKRKEMQFHIEVKEYIWFYFFWFGWAVVSLIWADSKGDALRHIWFMFSGISLIGFSIFHIKEEKDFRHLYQIFIAVLLMFLGVSLWEHVFRYNVGVGGSAVFFERGIPNGFLHNPNDLATFLTLYIPFFICPLFSVHKNRYRWMGIVGIPLALHVILLTRSRANILAVVIIIIGAIILMKPWKVLKKAGVWGAVIGAGIIVLLICLYNFNQDFWNFIEKEKQMILTQIFSLEGGSSVDIRVILLQLGYGLLRGHFFLGVGAGNVEYHLIPYREMTQGIVNMHNWWGEIFVNYGIIIGFMYLFFFAKMWWELFKIYKSSAEGFLKVIVQSLLVSFCGFAVAVTSSSTMAASRYMWVLFGFALCVINYYRRMALKEVTSPEKNSIRLK